MSDSDSDDSVRDTDSEFAMPRDEFDMDRIEIPRMPRVEVRMIPLMRIDMRNPDSNFDGSHFDELVSKIAANESFKRGMVRYYRRLGVDETTRLVNALKLNTSVTKLALSGNGDDCVATLASSLHTDSSITKLLLGMNDFTLKSTRALANFLEVNSTVLDLRLNGNKIGINGAMELGRALGMNSSVNLLVLCWNNVGDDGARYFAEGLLDNTALATLNLGENKISNNGARALLESLLLANHTLTNLILYNNHDISEEMKTLISELLQINRNALGNPREALERKIKWFVLLSWRSADLLGMERGLGCLQRMRVEMEVGLLINSDDITEDQAAVSLALDELGGFPQVDQRRRLFKRLLGSPKHGERVAESVNLAKGRELYLHAADYGELPDVLLNILRAHSSLCTTCTDKNHGLFPFMLLAAMPAAKVSHVMEALCLEPTLVERGIPLPVE